MKERTIITIVIGVLASALVAALGGTDGLYVVLSLLFFGICIAYAEWCERL